MSIDFPRAWQISLESLDSSHDKACSFIQTNHALLCDCDVLLKHKEYLDSKVLYTKDGKPYEI